MPAEFDPEARRGEERDGQEFLIYACGCFAYCTPQGEMKIIPCCGSHEDPVVEAIRDMLAELGLEPTSETREARVKN